VNDFYFLFLFRNHFFAAKPICPLIETLSFGSDINYRCNESHLVFNEFNVS